MKVLIVSPYFYPEGGGLERYAYELALELKKEHEVMVVCSTKGKPGKETLNGIRIVRGSPLFILSNTPIRPSLPFELLSLIKRERFDVIIAHTPVPFYADMASLVAKLTGVPLVVYYHVGKLEKGSWVDAIAKFYSHTLERFTLSGAKLIAVSHYVARLLYEKGFTAGVRYPKIGNIFLSSRPDYRGEHVLFVGQLTRAHRWKNLEMLLRAFTRVLKFLPNERLIVVGTGDLIEHYRYLAKELGIESSVVFRGFVSDEELVDLYKNAKLLVLPSSESEAFGKVVVEAMALGTPVVVSNVGELPFIVENIKGGLVVEPTVEELTDAILELLKDEKNRRKMGLLARRRVERLTNFPKV